MNIEEFVNYYLQNYRHEVLLNPYNGLVEFAKVFQEKLMEESLEGKIFEENYGPHRKVISEWTRKEIGNQGDKVRVIVLPKEN